MWTLENEHVGSWKGELELKLNLSMFNSCPDFLGGNHGTTYSKLIQRWAEANGLHQKGVVHVLPSLIKCTH